MASRRTVKGGAKTPDHPLSPTAATTAQAKRREPWRRFIASVAGDFSEHELGLMTWSTVKPIVEYAGIQDPLEVALVELEWRAHHSKLEEARQRIVEQDKVAAELRQREEEERQREAEEAQRRAEEEAARKEAEEAEAAERKKLGLGAGSPSTGRRTPLTTTGVRRLGTSPSTRPTSAGATRKPVAKPTVSAAAKPAAVSSPKHVTIAEDKPTAAKRASVTKEKQPTPRAMSPTTRTRNAESKAAAIISGGAVKATTSPPVRSADVTASPGTRNRVELDLFVNTPNPRDADDDGDMNAADASSPAPLLDEPEEEREPVCMDDCKGQFQAWCLYANGATEKAINFGRFMRWMKACGLIDRHFTPAEAEGVFRSTMAQGSPRRSVSTDANGRCPSVGSMASYATSAGDGQRMPYHVFRMKLLPEMASKLRCTTGDLVKKFHYCGGPKEGSPKKRVEVYYRQ